MTTNNKVRTEIQIVCKLENTLAVSRPDLKSKKKQQPLIAYGDNIKIFGPKANNENPFIQLKPIQKDFEKDTRAYEIYNDGTRREVMIRDLLAKIGPEPWFQINANLDADEHGDELDDIWNEDKSERNNTVILHIDTTSVENFNKCLDRGTRKSFNGYVTRHLIFTGKVSICRTDIVTNPAIEKPIDILEDASTARARMRAARDAVNNTTVAAKAAASITPDMEHIVVDNENPTCDELEDQLFAASHAKAPAPVGDFSNADLEREATSKKKSNKFW